MDIISEPLTAEQLPDAISAQSQPTELIPDKQPELDDRAVREAIAKAEAQGVDPTSLSMTDMQSKQDTAPAPLVSEAPKVEVPEKFLKNDGTVDVDKIVTSTKQLDEAIQKKEEGLQEIQRSIDDYLKEYKEKESKFRTMPNPDKLATSIPQPQPTSPQTMTDQQLRDILLRDYQADPLATTAQLIDIAIRKRFEPLEKKEKDEAIRSNINDLAKKDPRILNQRVFDAINAKLEKNPELWNLKNPHKAAWLEVKEEMQLGDLPKTNQVQPSTRTTSPILGGGPPPSVPSSSGSREIRSLDQLNSIDLRDRRQEEAGDILIRSMLERSR